ncbi:MAG: hypothetical protein KQH79_11315 [Bacteroidetes bacterium]|nr:hypothetical protein [Bacteroidota bacterium]
MKKLTLFLFLIAVFSSCEEGEFGVNYEQIELEDYIIENYLYDAKQLYYEEILNDSTHFNYNNTEFDTVEIYKILKIIQAVYNSGSQYRDEVFNNYSIHTLYCNSLNTIGLKVQTNSSEIINLVNGVIPTGNEQFDNILQTYKFDSIRTAYSYPDFPWLTLISSGEFNMIPIEEELNNIPAITIAEMHNGCFGDGNNISLRRSRKSAIITFSIGQLDCPAGCLYHKYWEFEVVNDFAKISRVYED